MIRGILIIAFMMSATSCSLFSKSKEEVRNDKVAQYIKNLREKRKKSEKKSDEWVDFYIPQR